MIPQITNCSLALAGPNDSTKFSRECVCVVYCTISRYNIRLSMHKENEKTLPSNVEMKDQCEVNQTQSNINLPRCPNDLRHYTQ